MIYLAELLRLPAAAHLLLTPIAFLLQPTPEETFVAASLLLLLSVAAIVYYILALYSATRFFSHTPLVNPEFHPPISILKPICGLDNGAYDNLASFCQQDYPNYQIIFGIQNQQDSSLTVVQQLIQDFPQIDIRYVISQQAIGANLKVTNLAYAAKEASHAILLLADSDIRVGSDYLTRVVQPLQNAAVGVVTCMYRSHTKGWLAAFEALSITTDFLPSVLVARTLEGMTFALGATIAIRTSVLEEIGGFAAVANYLEDDFHLGHLPAQLGYEVVLSDYVVSHVMDTSTLSDLIQHQTRWGRGTRYARPGGHLGLIFTQGTITSLLFCWALGGSLWGWLVMGITWSVRLLLAWVVGIKIMRDPVARKWLWLVPLRDGMSFILWIYSFFGNTVEWRGRKFRLAKGGRLIEHSSTTNETATPMSLVAIDSDIPAAVTSER